APEALRAPLPLERLALRASGNVLRIHAPKRWSEWSQRGDLQQIHPAVLRIVRAAPEWSRSTFHGLAQVIVQTTGAPGTLTLHAESPGLRATELQLRAESR